MLYVFCAPFCTLHSSFCIPCVMVACPAFQGSGFEVRGSRFKVQVWICGQFAQPADDFRALPAFAAAAQARQDRIRAT
jgi:hypothetical protein